MTRFRSLLDRLTGGKLPAMPNKAVTAAVAAPRVEEPRPYPKGINVLDASPEKLIFWVKAARKRWRWLPFALLIFITPALVWIGIAMGIDPGGYDRLGRYRAPSFSFMPVASIVALWGAFLFWLYKLFWLNLIFSVTPNRINVGGKTYDRAHSAGMRIGYTVEGNGGVGDSMVDVIAGDASMGFVGLRLTYGRWGEDLDFMVNRYHAAEYVVWMNEQIAMVGAAAPKDHDPAKGRRKSGL